MSQTENPYAGTKRKYSLLQIRNRPEARDQLTTGANVEFVLNGQKLPNLTFAKLEFKPRNVAKVTLEMLVEVEVDVQVESLKTTSTKDSGLNINGKPFALYTLSNRDQKGSQLRDKEKSISQIFELATP